MRKRAATTNDIDLSGFNADKQARQPISLAEKSLLGPTGFATNVYVLS